MAEPTVPVREMVDLIVDQWNRGLEAHEALRLLIPLTYRVLNAEPATGAGVDVDPRDLLLHPGDQITTIAGRRSREWFVDQAGGWVEAEPAPVVQQAWHGDDTAELRADDAKPAAQAIVTGSLSDSERTQNQWAATQALASGRISVEEVGAVVKGLHDASLYRVKPEVPGE